MGIGLQNGCSPPRKSKHWVGIWTPLSWSSLSKSKAEEKCEMDNWKGGAKNETLKNRPYFSVWLQHMSNLGVWSFVSSNQRIWSFVGGSGAGGYYIIFGIFPVFGQQLFWVRDRVGVGRGFGQPFFGAGNPKTTTTTTPFSMIWKELGYPRAWGLG